MTGSGPMANNRKRGQGASWTVSLAEEEEMIRYTTNPSPILKIMASRTKRAEEKYNSLLLNRLL
jgi:hypothetical protein